jgi:hypothetical protein
MNISPPILTKEHKCHDVWMEEGEKKVIFDIMKIIILLIIKLYNYKVKSDKIKIWM